MRVSFTFVLAVCAPLLALAAPISLNPPNPPAPKGDTVGIQGFPVQNFKRVEATPNWPTHNWKRDDDSVSADDGGASIDAIGSPQWKRDDDDDDDSAGAGASTKFYTSNWKRVDATTDSIPVSGI